jgi:hypothetical protein
MLKCNVGCVHLMRGREMLKQHRNKTHLFNFICIISPVRLQGHFCNTIKPVNTLSDSFKHGTLNSRVKFALHVSLCLCIWHHFNNSHVWISHIKWNKSGKLSIHKSRQNKTGKWRLCSQFKHLVVTCSYRCSITGFQRRSVMTTYLIPLKLPKNVINV